MFSKTCEYAIRAVIYIYKKSVECECKVSVKDIATNIQSPEHFTAKILQILSRQDIISSAKGPNGGFFMDIHQGQMNLLEVVKAIDGPRLFTGCVLGLSKCDDKVPCPIHAQYKPIRDKMNLMLSSTTIESLATKLDSGLVFLSK